MTELASTDVTRSVAEPLRPADHEPVPRDGARLGRYILLTEIGAGGMGVVHEAYDPDLHRKVAIKLVRASGAGREARGRILREAQALAQLTHPNVIAIHDVGIVDDDVYLAMELVVGDTVARWLAQRKRSWTEVLVVYVAAAEGLAAAHQKGLIHRDFKPDNVMIDDSGRVRVLDFGLARLADLHGEGEHDTAITIDLGLGSALGTTITREDKLLGTPAYMAPEQFLRHTDIDARADQFSFCVALWTGLYGVPPFAGATFDTHVLAVLSGRLESPPVSAIPRWLHRVLVRGLARAPGERFASMLDLLAAIERGQARRRRRPLWLVVGALAFAGAAALGWSRVQRSLEVAACDDASAAIDAAWTPETRTGLERALRESGHAYAADTAAKVLPRLDAWVDDWAAQRRQICLDASDGTLPPELAASSQACFEDLELSFEVFVEGLAQPGATDSAIESAIKSAMGLPRPGDCADVRYLRLLPPLPEGDPEAVRALRRQIARSKGLDLAGRYDLAVDEAERACVEAERLGFDALTAEAQLRLAVARGRKDELEQAEEAATAAYVTATKVGATRTAAAAATYLVFLVGFARERPDAGLAWAKSAEAALAIVEPEPGPMTIELLRQIGAVHHRSANYSKARDVLTQALELQEQLLSPDHPSLSHIIEVLASTLRYIDGHPEMIALAERARAIDERAFGTRHPRYGMTLSNLGTSYMAVGRYAEATSALEQAHAILSEALGPEHHYSLAALANLAWLRLRAGETEAAARMFEQAIEIHERAHEHGDLDAFRTMVAKLAFVRYSQGRLDLAAEQYVRAIRLYDDAELEPPVLIEHLNNLGLVQIERGDPAAARKALERARALCERLQGADSKMMGIILSNLGHVHRLTGAATEARVLYEQALALDRVHMPADDGLLSYPLTGLAKLELELGRPAQALAPAEQAMVLRTSGPFAPRYRAESRLVLARALWDAPADAGRDRERAVTIATEAVAALASETGVEPEREALQAWLAEHQP